jgi:hypothetical protein
LECGDPPKGGGDARAATSRTTDAPARVGIGDTVLDARDAGRGGGVAPRGGGVAPRGGSAAPRALSGNKSACARRD